MTSFLNKRPQVNIVAVNICCPCNDVFRVTKIFRVGAQLDAVNIDQRFAASGGTNRPLQLARAQPVEEAAIHRAKIQHARSSGIGVGQNRLWAKLIAHLLQARCDGGQRVIPRDALEGVSFLPARLRAFWHT